MELLQERGNKDEIRNTSMLSDEEFSVPQSSTPFISSGDELLQWLSKNNARSPTRPKRENAEETCAQEEQQVNSLLNRKKLDAGLLVSSRDKKHYNGLTFLEPLAEEELEIRQENGNKKSPQRQVCWSSWEIMADKDGMDECTRRSKQLTRISKFADTKSTHENETISPNLSLGEHTFNKNPGRSRNCDLKAGNLNKSKVMQIIGESCGKTLQVLPSVAHEKQSEDAQNHECGTCHESNNETKHLRHVSNKENKPRALSRKQFTPSVGKIPPPEPSLLERHTSEKKHETSNEEQCLKERAKLQESDAEKSSFEHIRVKRKLSSSISPNPNPVTEQRDVHDLGVVEIRKINSIINRRRSCSDSNLIQKEKESGNFRSEPNIFKPKSILKHKRLSLASTNPQDELNLPKLIQNSEQEEKGIADASSAHQGGGIFIIGDERNITEGKNKLGSLVISPRISHSLKPSKDNEVTQSLSGNLQDRVKSFLEKPIPRNGELPTIKSEKVLYKKKSEKTLEQSSQPRKKHDIVNFHTCPNLDLQNMSQIFYHKKEGRCRYLRVPQSPTPPVEWVFEN